MSNKSTVRYIAGGLFGLLGILSLVSNLKGSISILSLLWPIGCILIAVGLFTFQRALATVGAAGLVLSEIRTIIILLPSFRDGYGYMGFNYVLREGIPYVILLAAFVLLLVATLARGASMPLGIVSAAVYASYYLIIILRYHINSPSMAILRALLFIVGTVLLGIAFQKKGQAKAVPGNVSPDMAEKIEQLISLKDLLDKGVLTQQEFEEKKQQIIG